MDSEKTKILMVVEGQKTDVALMNHLLSVYGINQNHEIVSYNTNLYVLYDQIFTDDTPESIDLLQHLKEKEPDEKKKSLFDIHYSDIILVFDLDPHDPRFSADKIIRMVEFFTESSDMVKLYINYPMVESFYHMKSIPDPDYNSYVVTLDELKSGEYKTKVNRENRNHDYRKFAVDRNECNIVIKQNIAKANTLCADNTNDKLPDLHIVLEKQLDLMKGHMYLSVLCTCAFYVIDYNPKLLD